MAAALAHRGPGERGVVAAGASVLGSARLHVTSPGAPSGPYAALDGRVVATVNGEIWNHDEIRRDLRARGIAVPDGPDTAVVAPLFAACGVDGLRRLRGMFAIAIHDTRDGATVLARDRFGIKPLYFRDGPELHFASEPGVLPASGDVDRRALHDYLVLGVVPAPRTLDRSVEKVPAGTALVFGADGRRAARIAPMLSPGDDPPDPHAVRDALSRAVRRHLMGDVPLGVFLSGGLDSAAVAALVRETGAPLRTFAMTFPGEGAYDEAAAARRSAELLGAEHVETAFRPADLPGLIDDCARHFGEPFGDSSALAVLALSRVAARHVTVVLTGTGADELFLGYRRYAFGAVPPGTAAAARAAAALLPASRRGALGTAGALARKLAASCSAPDPASRYLERLAVVPAAWRMRLMGETSPPPVLTRVRDAFAGARSFADGARAADLDIYLPDDLLAKEDRTTMACGLENRVPFLDDAVADLAGSIPAHAHGRDKRLLRRALRGLLPTDIIRRRKHGFAVPVSEWMRAGSAHLVDDLLGAPDARVRDHLDGGALDALVARHRGGDDGLGPALYALVALEASLRHAR
jgi:asparagine synthase (glutamine-hydrolysing)